jgi:hypothetical protein
VAGADHVETLSLSPLGPISTPQVPALKVILSSTVRWPIELPGSIVPPLLTMLPVTLPLPLSRPLPLTVTSLVSLPFTARPPALMVVPPPTRLVPVRLSLPAPFLVSVPLPLMPPAQTPSKAWSKITAASFATAPCRLLVVPRRTPAQTMVPVL